MHDNQFKYSDERFADLQMLRYRLNGFESLSLSQKLYIFCLAKATLMGRDITFDQQPQITGTDTEEDTSSQGGNNGGYNGQMPENWQEFYNYFFGNRG